MTYIKESKVRLCFHENGKQITKDGLHQVDIKVYEFIRKLCNSPDCRQKRITGMTVEMFKM